MASALELRRQVCFSLYAATRAITGLYRPLLEPLGLTYPQYLVLLVLWERGECSVKDLGETLMLDSGTLSPLLKRLEKAGLVTRRRDHDDERSVLVALTGPGDRLRERAAGIPAALAAASGLSTKDLAALRTTLVGLTDSVNDAKHEILGEDQHMNVLYTARATATGDGRNGHVRSSDGVIDTDVAVPKEMGGAGGSTNPEQLFAAGYAVCYHNALRLVARRMKATVDGSEVSAEVGIGPVEGGAFGLRVTLRISLPGVDRELAGQLVDAAHRVCPYSNATRGNIVVDLVIV